MSVRSKATVEDLYHLPENGKAEIVNGELVLLPPTGDMPSRAGFNLAVPGWRMSVNDLFV